MHCPYCRETDTRVIDSRVAEDGTSIRRRRSCAACQKRFTTVEQMQLTVLKRSGATEPFTREKAVTGVRKAYKGPRSVCGVHNYSDTNRFRQTGTKAIIKALGCKQIWLTEAGGLYKFVGYKADQKRQLKATKYMFKVAKANKKIKRLYVYSWFGAPRSARFDSGLINPNGTPRKAYAEVRKHVK